MRLTCNSTENDQLLQIIAILRKFKEILFSGFKQYFCIKRIIRHLEGVG